MSWQPPRRAAWVATFNSGVAADSSVSPLPPGLVGPAPSLAEIGDRDWFNPDRLLGQALAVRGHASDEVERFGASDFLEPFSILTQALTLEAALHPLGRWVARRYLARLLDGRIGLQAGASVAAESQGARSTSMVSRPIFVIGAPRTGTTVLHRMLAAVDGLRAPEGWEFLYPCPSLDDRVNIAGNELVLPQTIAAGLDQIHAYSARMPKECLSAMAFSFRSEEFISRFNVPSYADWLDRADMTPAYEIHRQVLVALQNQVPISPVSGSGRPRASESSSKETTRWVLKSPVHLGSLPTLLEVYPDAVLVATHRSPNELLASVTSLIATLRSAFSDHVDARQIGAYHLELYAKRLENLVDLADSRLLRDRIHHLTHQELIADPQQCVDTLSHDLGLAGSAKNPVSASVMTRVSNAIESPSDRSDALGRHHYDPADFDLDPDVITQRFARYQERFL